MRGPHNITPCLWFDHEAEEAANFYVSLFENSRIVSVLRTGDPGSVLVVNFELEGRPFTALNGGPHFQFTEAVSFVINCETQAEVDRFWAALLKGGQPSQCGWLKDRFGLSWQIVPTALGRMLADPDRAAAGRAMAAMMKMVKLDIAEMERAHRGE